MCFFILYFHKTKNILTMKDYIEIFDETYRESFKQHRKETNKKSLIFRIVIFISSLLICFVIVILNNILLATNNDNISMIEITKIVLMKKTLWIIFLGISVIITQIVYKARNHVANNNFYADKALEFATTIYLDGFMTTLQNTFTVDADFKEQVKQKMKEAYWYNQEDEIFCPYLSFEGDSYFKQKIVQKSTGKEYYLINWKDKKTGFFLECVKSEGKMEVAEFFLPI